MPREWWRNGCSRLTSKTRIENDGDGGGGGVGDDDAEEDDGDADEVFGNESDDDDLRWRSRWCAL